MRSTTFGRLIATAVLIGLIGLTPRGACAQERAADATGTRFVVLGHVRSEPDALLHPRLGELLDQVREIAPRFIVLSGDNIWGDFESRPTPADGEWVLEQWVALDSALATLDVPVYRVPGNHDIHDSVTFGIYEKRYGRLPAVVDVGRTRLILLTTAWDEARPNRHAAIRGFGYHLDDAQKGFLRERLAEREQYDRAFVVMHHVLWWEPDDAPWWTEVHPILAEAGVEAVFTGDYGPVKFSHSVRDGVDYFQSGIAGNPSVGNRKNHEWDRLLARQFDNFLVVDIADGDVTYDVESTGEISSDHFTRELWWEVHGTIVPPGAPSGREHLAALWAIPRGKLVVIGALGLFGLTGLVLGLLFGWRVHRKTAGL
jgi:hypothetical protein